MIWDYISFRITSSRTARSARRWDARGVFRKWSFAATQGLRTGPRRPRVQRPVGGKLGTGFHQRTGRPTSAAAPGLPDLRRSRAAGVLEPVKSTSITAGAVPALGFTSSHKSAWYVARFAMTPAGGRLRRDVHQTIHPSSQFEIRSRPTWNDAGGEMH